MQILLEQISNLLDMVINPLEFIVISLLVIFYIYKNIKDKKQTGKFNWIRMILLGTFICFEIQSILAFLNNITWTELNLPEFFQSMRETHLTLGGISIGLLVVLGLTLTTYGLQYKSLYYTPTFIYSGIVFIYYYTGLYIAQPFIIYGGAIGLAFMYYTSFRIKDNGAIGLSVFYTLAFASIIIETLVIPQILNLGYIVFGVIFTLGFFKPFKEANKEVEQ